MCNESVHPELKCTEKCICNLHILIMYTPTFCNLSVYIYIYIYIFKTHIYIKLYIYICLKVLCFICCKFSFIYYYIYIIFSSYIWPNYSIYFILYMNRIIEISWDVYIYIINNIYIYR